MEYTLATCPFFRDHLTLWDSSDATSDGTATAGSDYAAVSGMLVFAAGEMERTVNVPVLDDAHDERTETLMLTLSNPSGLRIVDGEATGRIANTDPMPGAWLARFGRMMGSQAVEALAARFAEGDGSRGMLGGQAVGVASGAFEAQSAPPPWWRGEDRAEARTMTPEAFLAGTSFHLAAGGDAAVGPGLAVWGRFAQDRFEADDGDGSMDGDVTTGFFGADAEWERLLAGMMVSYSQGEGTYRGAQQGGIESSVTVVYPYARLHLNERVSVWGLAGTGRGELALEPNGEAAMRTDVALRMVATGVDGRVLKAADGLALTARLDAMWVGVESDAAELAASDSDVTRLRLLLDGERGFDVGDGARVTPSGRLGLRLDGGDVDTGTGAELVAGLRYAAGRLTVEGSVRALIAHEESGYEEWGASGAVRLDPDALGRGLSLSLSPTWGHTANDADRLWTAPDAGAFGLAGEDSAQARLEVDLGYGFSLPGGPGVVTPWARVSATEGGSRTDRLGLRWTLAPASLWQASDAALTLEAARHRSANDNEDERRIAIKARFRW